MSTRLLALFAAAVAVTAAVLVVRVSAPDRAPGQPAASESLPPLKAVVTRSQPHATASPLRDDVSTAAIASPRPGEPSVMHHDSPAADPASASARDRAGSGRETPEFAPGRQGGLAIRARAPTPEPMSPGDEKLVFQKSTNRALERAACRAPGVQTRYAQLPPDKRAAMRATCATYGIPLGE